MLFRSPASMTTSQVLFSVRQAPSVSAERVYEADFDRCGLILTLHKLSEFNQLYSLSSPSQQDTLTRVYSSLCRITLCCWYNCISPQKVLHFEKLPWDHSPSVQICAGMLECFLFHCSSCCLFKCSPLKQNLTSSNCGL